MLKVEKNAKTLDEALNLAAEELGVSKDEVSYTITKQIGKGLMKFLVGSEVEILAWRTADEAAEKVAEKTIEAPVEMVAEAPAE